MEYSNPPALGYGRSGMRNIRLEHSGKKANLKIGDLYESDLKRRLNVKDSGEILPGHGGLLDRFDGYLFTVPGFYLFFFAI